MTDQAELTPEERKCCLGMAFGIWSDREDGELEAIQASLRPGLGRKLETL